MTNDSLQGHAGRRRQPGARSPSEGQLDERQAGGPHHDPLRTRRAGQQTILSIRATINESDTTSFLEDALDAIHAYMQQHDIQPAGGPFALCRSTGENTIDIEAGWPLERPVEGHGRIQCGSLPHGLVRQNEHTH
jgi:hypothetical protein